MFVFPLMYFNVTGILLTSEKINLQLVQCPKCRCKVFWLDKSCHVTPLWSLCKCSLFNTEYRFGLLKPCMVMNLYRFLIFFICMSPPGAGGRLIKACYLTLNQDLKQSLTEPLQSVRLFSLSLFSFHFVFFFVDPVDFFTTEIRVIAGL